jgi:hypothetical protein
VVSVGRSRFAWRNRFRMESDHSGIGSIIFDTRRWIERIEGPQGEASTRARLIGEGSRAWRVSQTGISRTSTLHNGNVSVGLSFI